MPFTFPSKAAGTTHGSGRGVCLLLIANGLGDAIHTMPAIAELLLRGPVTVYCRAFHAPIYEALGCRVIVPTEPLSCSFKDDHAGEYERILDYPHWGGWECSELGDNVRPQMEQFAELCDVELPNSFSWIDTLKPEVVESSILFVPEATEVWRTLPDAKAWQIFRALQSEYDNVEWVSVRRTGDCFADLQRELLESGEDPDKPDFLQRLRAKELEWNASENGRLHGKLQFASFREMLNAVYSAERIISVENGISNLAGALGKDLTLLAGPTSGEQIIGQYVRYHSISYDEIRADMLGCHAPCWRHERNGFTNGLCQGLFSEPQCLAMIPVEQILQSQLA